MANKAFMLLKGHRSDSVGGDPAHRGWILLESVILGDRPGAGLGTQGQATRKRGEATLGDMTLVRELDGDSVALQESCRTGQPLIDIVIEICGTARGTGVRRTVRCTISQAVIVRHHIYRQGKGTCKASSGREEILLRCAKTTFQHS
jgi:type VI protein secretion system component Hcp